MGSSSQEVPSSIARAEPFRETVAVEVADQDRF